MFEVPSSNLQSFAFAATPQVTVDVGGRPSDKPLPRSPLVGPGSVRLLGELVLHGGALEVQFRLQMALVHGPGAESPWAGSAPVLHRVALLTDCASPWHPLATGVAWWWTTVVVPAAATSLLQATRKKYLKNERNANNRSTWRNTDDFFARLLDN